MMPPKRLASSPASGKEPKHQKKAMTQHEKVELLDMVKEGKSYAGEYNKIKIFLIYHYNVHIILHYYCF